MAFPSPPSLSARRSARPAINPVSHLIDLEAEICLPLLSIEMTTLAQYCLPLFLYRCAGCFGILSANESFVEFDTQRSVELKDFGNIRRLHDFGVSNSLGEAGKKGNRFTRSGSANVEARLGLT